LSPRDRPADVFSCFFQRHGADFRHKNVCHKRAQAVALRGGFRDVRWGVGTQRLLAVQDKVGLWIPSEMGVYDWSKYAHKRLLK